MVYGLNSFFTPEETQLKRSLYALSLSISLLLPSFSSLAAEEVALKEEVANVPNFPKEKLPLKKVALSSVNVRVGVHLERLTLISGEGNTEKKVLAGVMAGAFSLLGAGRGTDFAEKEPLEDHLTSADAQKIADDIAKLITDAVSANGLELVPPEQITPTPAYAAVEGESKITTDTENVKGNMFKPSYFFGYQQVPVLGYKFRKKQTIFFGVPSDNASTRVREASGVPLTLAWSVSVVNDRKVMRIRELSLSCYGQGPGPLSDGDDKIWATVAVDPDTLSVPSGESHQNLAYWATLSPQVSTATHSMMKRMTEKFASVSP